VVQVPQGIRDSLESMQLPSMPQILLRFLSLAEDDAASMADLAELVGQDPALSARVLTVVNSVAFRRGSATTSLVNCMVTLGTRLSRTLASCLVIQKAFSPAAITARYDLSGFWMHSLLVAELSRTIAEQSRFPEPAEAYLAGLLHDVGQLLLLGGLEERYGSLLASSRDETVLRLLEEQRLGTDHTAIGAWMVDRWGVSSSFMADAVLFHHADAAEIQLADQLSQLVWTAHLICQHSRLYQAEPFEIPLDFKTPEALFGIGFDQAGPLYEQATKSIAVLAEALGVSSPADGRTLPFSILPFDPAAIRLPDLEATLSPVEEAVRDMALLKPLQHDLASVKHESELYLAAQESARILFGLSAVGFLTLQQDTNVLSGSGGDFQPELLQRLAIPLDSGSSLALAAFQERSPKCTFTDEETPVRSLVDVQIARIMGVEGVIYLPMTGASKTLGVMICGVAASHARRLVKRMAWMNNFAHTAATGIESWRELQQQSASREADLTRQYEHHARKVVHEASNPLGIIKNYLSIMSKKLPADTSLLQEIGILKEEIDRVTQILRGMNSFADPVAAGRSVNMNDVIETMLVLYRESLFECRGIMVHLDLEQDLPPVAADRDLLKQILFNIWNNASDAMHQGGTLQITTRPVFVQDGHPCIEIVMRDSGPGLPADVIQRLFTPLDQNRRPGHAGMGLSIVADLVKRLEGRITCQSKPGQGTAFSILLPVQGPQQP